MFCGWGMMNCIVVVFFVEILRFLFVINGLFEYLISGVWYLILFYDYLKEEWFGWVNCLNF